MKKLNRVIKIVIFSFLVLLIIFSAILWRVSDDCNHIQCQLAAIMPRMAVLQKEVEFEIRNSITERKLEGIKGIDFGYIEKDGSIVIVNESTEMIVIAHPEITEDTVVWKCRAYPERANTFDLLSDCSGMFRKK